jgi:DNA-directed RNA polymerase specialized sigma subunit
MKSHKAILVYMSIEDLTLLMDYRHSQGLAASFEELEAEEISEMDRRRLIRAINTKLTKRQKQVINMVRQGMSGVEIGRRLEISKTAANNIILCAIKRLKGCLMTNK